MFWRWIRAVIVCIGVEIINPDATFWHFVLGAIVSSFCWGLANRSSKPKPAKGVPKP